MRPRGVSFSGSARAASRSHFRGFAGPDCFRNRFALAMRSRCSLPDAPRRWRALLPGTAICRRPCAPLSVTLALDREVDISRGDFIVGAVAPATVARRFKASAVWMDRHPLQLHRRYLLKHTSQTVPVLVQAVEHRADLGTLAHESAASLQMNDIGVISLDLLRPIALDLYGENRACGAFILIDPRATRRWPRAWYGRIGPRNQRQRGRRGGVGPGDCRRTRGAVGTSWRRAGAERLGGVTDAVERSLFSVGVVSSRIEADDDAFLLHPQLLEIVRQWKRRSGILALVVRQAMTAPLTARVGRRRAEA